MAGSAPVSPLDRTRVCTRVYRLTNRNVTQDVVYEITVTTNARKTTHSVLSDVVSQVTIPYLLLPLIHAGDEAVVSAVSFTLRDRLNAGPV